MVFHKIIPLMMAYYVKRKSQFLATKDREALESALVMILTLMIKMSWTYLHH